MKLYVSLVLFLIMTISANSQNDVLPYAKIPEPTMDYTAGSVVSRMIDGLGFRYYWATEGLTEKDLNFQPSKEARSTMQTINHIFDLSQVILNSALGIPNESSQLEINYQEKRKLTLENLHKASTIFVTENDLSKFKIVFGKTALPFWNTINGPISDALWHVGQLVSFRRSSGNPLPKGVNFLTGERSEGNE